MEPEAAPASATTSAAMAHPVSSSLLEVTALQVAYGKRQVIFDISMHVRPGEVVALLGPNGAGKTTLLKAIFGLLGVGAGSVRFAGEKAGHRSPSENVRAGASFTPAESAVFRDLSVEDNLELGAFSVVSRQVKDERIEKVYGLFPILSERRRQAAGTISGGQQRMLSIGMALMSGPRLMLLDEPSLGLAPGLAQQMLEEVKRLSATEGLAVLLVEQNVRAALRVSERAYFMRSGRILLEESAEAALARGKWWDLF